MKKYKTSPQTNKSNVCNRKIENIHCNECANYMYIYIYAIWIVPISQIVV